MDLDSAFGLSFIDAVWIETEFIRVQGGVGSLRGGEDLVSAIEIGTLKSEEV